MGSASRIASSCWSCQEANETVMGGKCWYADAANAGAVDGSDRRTDSTQRQLP